MHYKRNYHLRRKGEEIYSRLKEARETWQLSATTDPRLSPILQGKLHWKGKNSIKGSEVR